MTGNGARWGPGQPLRRVEVRTVADVGLVRAPLGALLPTLAERIAVRLRDGRAR